jgi:hypothetical protein
MANSLKKAWFERIGYVPHPQQWGYHNSDARFRVPVCGRRFGKSTMAGRDLEPYLMTPNKRYWIVGPTYDLAEKEFRVIWDDMIVKLGLGREKRLKRGYNKRSGEMYLEFPWQTRLEVRSADHPEYLVGEALDGAIMSEAAKQKKETWERFIRPSLADKRGWATFPTTPEGFNWLYDLWMLGISGDTNLGVFESFKFPSWANTAVYPGGRQDAEIILLERTTTPEWFMQEIGADFASFVGKIFPEFDETVHVRNHQYNPQWKNYIAFDWGYTNPLAAIEFQVSPDDRIFVWREYYKSFMQLGDVVEELKGRPHPPDYRIDLAFGDAADPAAAEYVSGHLVGCIADPDAKKKEMWGVGIRLMRAFMKADRFVGEKDEYGTPDYEPSFFIDPSCTNMIREMNNYRAKESKGLNVPELGNNVENHTIDALRYAIVQLYYLGAQHHLTDVYTPTDSSLIINATASSSHGREFALPTVGGFGSGHGLGSGGSGDDGFFSLDREF